MSAFGGEFRKLSTAGRAAILAGVIAAAAGTGLACWLHDWPVHHFGIVVPGAIYSYLKQLAAGQGQGPPFASAGRDPAGGAMMEAQAQRR